VKRDRELFETRNGFMKIAVDAGKMK